jgi:[acyl-carrier-protein] S-malonyltransferase
MGRDLAETYPLARSLFDQADHALGYGLSKVCFQGPEDELTKTEHAQPAIYLVGWIAYRLLCEQAPSLEAGAAAGLSLGEFTALAAAGVFSFEDGLSLVRQRGRFMQEACEATEGGMAAVIGLDDTAIREVCEQAEVHLANLNCPGQLVISGPLKAIDRACDLAKKAGARRALPLPVAGAYHSPLMVSAQTKLKGAIAELALHPATLPVISNVTAQPHNDPTSVQDLLVRQVTASVLWEKSIQHLLTNGFTRFIELGPGKALSGFMKRINPAAESFNIADVLSLEATVRAITTGTSG